MCTERITCYKNLFFLNKSSTSYPANEDSEQQKLKRLISDRHLLFIPCRNADKIPVYDLFQETERTSRSDHLHLRTIIEKAFYASGMIRLCMYLTTRIIVFSECRSLLEDVPNIRQKTSLLQSRKELFCPPPSSHKNYKLYRIPYT